MKETSRKNNLTTYKSWQSMKYRCYNPKSISFRNYGGKGIKVCKSWLESFENFLTDMGPRPAGTSIDRIDNSGDYEPGNCRWATREEQNNKRSNVFYVEGVSLAKYCRENNLNYKRVHARINRYGMSVEEAVKPEKRKGGFDKRPYWWSTKKKSTVADT